MFVPHMTGSCCTHHVDMFRVKGFEGLGILGFGHFRVWGFLGLEVFGF